MAETARIICGWTLSVLSSRFMRVFPWILIHLFIYSTTYSHTSDLKYNQAVQQTEFRGNESREHFYKFIYCNPVAYFGVCAYIGEKWKKKVTKNLILQTEPQPQSFVSVLFLGFPAPQLFYLTFYSAVSRRTRKYTTFRNTLIFPPPCTHSYQMTDFNGLVNRLFAFCWIKWKTLIPAENFFLILLNNRNNPPRYSI